MVEPGFKSKLAKLLLVERTAAYRKSTILVERNAKDIALLKRVHEAEPRYGVRRLSMELKWGIKKTRRIKKLAGIQVVKPDNRKRVNRGKKAEIPAPDNLTRQYWQYRDAMHPEKGYDLSKLTEPGLDIWAQDFTYIYWHNRFYYLAVTMRLADRRPVGWKLGMYHTAELICDTLMDGLVKYNRPLIVHNDRGTEYMSKKHCELCNAYHIQMSASAPGEPWQNPYMESFFNTFKSENLQAIHYAETEVEIYEIIAAWMYYYTYERIHTEFKMPPAEYAKRLGLGEPTVLLPATKKNELIVA